MAEQTEPKSTVEDAIAAAAPGDKRKLEPDMSAEQANVIKKFKDGKLQPGKIARLPSSLIHCAVHLYRQVGSSDDDDEHACDVTTFKNTAYLRRGSDVKPRIF